MTVENLYKETKEKLSTEGIEGDELETRTIELVHFHLRSQGKSKADLFFGVVIGYDNPIDMANLRGKVTKRDAAVQAAKDNLTSAISSGKVALLETNDTKLQRIMLDPKTRKVMTDSVAPDLWKEYIIELSAGRHVVPLDSMETYPGTTAKNFNYLKPLPLTQWTTDVEGIVKHPTGQYQRFTLSYNQPKHPGTIPMYTPIEFKAVSKGDKDGVLIMNSSKFTEFVPSKQELGVDVAELINRGYAPYKLLSSQLDEYHAAHKDKPYDTLVLLEGLVYDIRVDTVVPFIKLDDFSKDTDQPYLKVNLHTGIPVNFGRESKVLVLGRTKINDKWTPETGVQKGVPGDLVVNAMGVYPRFSTKATVEKVDKLV